MTIERKYKEDRTKKIVTIKKRMIGKGQWQAVVNCPLSIVNYKKMNIFLLGSGGREHAIAWKIAQSPKVDRLFIAPGNAGTALVGTNVNIKADDFPAIKEFVLANHIDMVVVGPEDPLVKGVYDYFKNDAALTGIPVIGPSKEGAQLEGSKDFAKAFMMRHNIPLPKIWKKDRHSSKNCRPLMC